VHFFKKAVDIDPANAAYHRSIAFFYRSVGMLEEANRHYEMTLHLDPLNIGNYSYSAGTKFHSSRFDEARELIKKGREFEDYWVIEGISLLITYLESDIKDFEHELIIYKSKFPDRSAHLEGLLAAWKNRKDEALALVNNNALISRVLIYRQLEMKKEAISYLDSLSNTWSPSIATYPVLKNHKMYDFVRNEPEFLALVEKQRIQYEENVKKYRIKE
jgi:tetratricopeptide (TPR) repeat protein